MHYLSGMKLGLLTDIHEDYPQLEKAIRVLEHEGCDQLICLGDVVGFSVPRYQFYRERNGHACIQLIREKCSLTVAGNHDFHAARKTPAASSGFTYPTNWYEMRFNARKKHAQGKVWLYEMMELSPLLTEEDEHWLRQLPESATLNVGSDMLLFSHYVAPNVTGHLSHFAEKPADFTPHFNWMAQHGCALAFTGHHHVDGVLTVTSTEVRHAAFGHYQLPETPVIINLPCVVRDRNPSGVATYDTDTRQLAVLPI